MIRILVADDHAVVRAGIVALLSDEPDLQVVGEAVDGIEAVALAAQLVARVRQPALPTLTPRETEVLPLVATGLTNRQIGKRLHLGEATVKTHLLRTFDKLGVSDRTRAVTLAMERGLL